MYFVPLFWVSKILIASAVLTSFVRSHEGGASTPIQTWISPSAILEEIPYMRVYEQDSDLVFPIQDIPTPTPLRSPSKTDTCNNACVMAKITSSFNMETFKQLEVMQNLFTARGINNVPYNPSKLSDLNDMVDVMNQNPRVNKTWIQEWHTALEDRKLGGISNFRTRRDAQDYDFEIDENNQCPENHTINNTARTMNKRAIAVPVSALAGMSGKFFGALGLKSIFVNHRTLLPALSYAFDNLPKLFGSFLSVPKRISEFVAVRKHASEENDRLIPQFKKAYEEPQPHWVDARQSPKSFSDIHQIIQQIGELQSMTTMTISQTITFESCRDKKIPMLVVPPTLLRERLELQKMFLNETGSDLEQVISPEEYMKLYSMNIADCRFDDYGGIVAVKVFLKRKSAEYRVYKFKSYAFQFHNLTCEVQIPSSIIIQEKNSGALYTISDIDQDFCSPKHSPMCRLPYATNADVPNQYCLTTLMQGGSSAEIKSACPITCRAGERVTSVQEDLDTIIVSHLPQKGSYVTCGDGQKNQLHHNLTMGALRIVLGCGCHLYLSGKVIGSSVQKICSVPRPPFQLEYVLPVQLTKLNDWMPDFQDGFRGMKFRNVDDIVDDEFNPYRGTATSPETTSIPPKYWPLAVIPVLNMIATWVAISCLCCRSRHEQLVAAAVATAGNVQAKPVECKDSGEEEILEYIILALMGLYAIPLTVDFFYTKIQKYFDNIVDQAATRRVETEIESNV